MSEDTNQDTSADPKDSPIVIEKAGVVAFGPEGTDIALTTTDQDHSKWVLPKGHLEKSDTSLASCALREADEELGWSVELLQETPIGVVTRYLGEDQESERAIYEKVTFFLGRLNMRLRPGERPVMFLALDEAIRILSHREHAAVVVAGIKRLAVLEALQVKEDKNES